MRIEINEEIKRIIDEYPGNKGAKKSVLKIYAALWILEKRKNKWGYFPVSSSYLKKINVRYFKIIDYFEEIGLLESYKRPFDDENNLFESKMRKYWSSVYGICMRYRFLKDINGEKIEVGLISKEKKRWYEITKKSLEEVGFKDVWISRDDYGRRLYHNGVRGYREVFKGYWSIDSVASHPRLLWLEMKEKGLIDKEYNDIFESGKDFYDEMIRLLDLESRREAKDIFMEWINGRGWVSNYKIKDIFKITNDYIESNKKIDYKYMSSKLQRIESSIWIDDLLENIPTDWALTIHDCLIIKENDVDKIFEWCKEKYPQLEFKKTLIC